MGGGWNLRDAWGIPQVLASSEPWWWPEPEGCSMHLEVLASCELASRSLSAERAASDHALILI